MRNHFFILLAENNDDHYLLIKDAFQQGSSLHDVKRVENGEELLDYLLHQGRYQDPATSPSPSLILLDLNMPKKDGREALMEIKSHPVLRKIPTVILTTSNAEKDILDCYDYGANTFIRKPMDFDQLVKTLQVVVNYWFKISELPTNIHPKDDMG